jgi:hypothetical protein
MLNVWLLKAFWELLKEENAKISFRFRFWGDSWGSCWKFFLLNDQKSHPSCNMNNSSPFSNRFRILFIRRGSFSSQQCRTCSPAHHRSATHRHSLSDYESHLFIWLICYENYYICYYWNSFKVKYERVFSHSELIQTSFAYLLIRIFYSMAISPHEERVVNRVLKWDHSFWSIL